ncbi:hypothetical protein CSA17_06785 [bacterium DOLJORAL78_65_58]|nr:MAG: hypothetical protein CSA17_06785 [bacterium DOLJORAL78_65_58]
MHLHHILKGAVAAGHEVDLVCSGYAGAPASDEIDGVRIHRRGHWAVANFTLPPLVRSMLKRERFDLLVEDINKIPFYTPLYRGRTPLVAIVPHLFGKTVYREANPLTATYVFGAESLIPRVYRDVDFEVISPSTRDDLIARGMDGDRIRTIYCGTEHERFALADPPPRNPTPLIVSWSRLRRYKSVDVALRAFRHIHQAVASDAPGLRDSVRHGETGTLVPYGDAQAFAAAALELLRAPDRWQAHSEAARRWAATFSWERCARESLELFTRVAGGGGR